MYIYIYVYIYQYADVVQHRYKTQILVFLLMNVQRQLQLFGGSFQTMQWPAAVPILHCSERIHRKE